MARRHVRVSGSGAYSRTTDLAQEFYIQNEASVLAAIRECDSVGRDQFLRKYGFKRARRITLKFDQQEYDPRAIFAVASQHEGRTPKALTAKELSLLILRLSTDLEDNLTSLGFEILEGPKVEVRKPFDPMEIMRDAGLSLDDL